LLGEEEAALLSAAAPESPTLGADPFAGIEESELFAELEVSELGVAEELDGFAVWLESSLLRCASLVAESFCVFPRFDCANAGAAAKRSAARIAILMGSSSCGPLPSRQGRIGKQSYVAAGCGACPPVERPVEG